MSVDEKKSILESGNSICRGWEMRENIAYLEN